MSALAPVIGMLVAAAITPGPNNMIVMEAGVRGSRAAFRAILGVVSGTVILLALAWYGIAATVEASPQLKLTLAMAGAAYLAWLGVRLACQGQGRSAADAPERALPTSAPAIAAFQLMNPKAWVLVMTVTAALPATSIVALTALIVPITSSCLALWAVAGAATSRLLERPGARLVFDRTMGALLALSAAGTVAHALTE